MITKLYGLPHFITQERKIIELTVEAKTSMLHYDFNIFAITDEKCLNISWYICHLNKGT